MLQVQFLLVLVCCSSYYSHAFHLNSARSGFSTRLFSSSSSRSNEDATAPNLYQILGASPKDSDVELKRKWQQLARRLHPDANVGRSTDSKITNYPYALSDINAAYGVLSDPKERRRYDRALQAQELADTFEILLDAGIKTAIPFIRKTANTTMAAVETSSKTWQDVSAVSNKVMLDVNKRVRNSAAIYDLESESKLCEKKALSTKARIQRLRKELDTQYDRQSEVLQTPNLKLSSSDATKLWNKFEAIVGADKEDAIFTDQQIDLLEQLELQLKQQQQYWRSTQQSLATAQRQAENAIQAEQLAQRRLEQAQQALADAQAENHACQKAQFEAVQLEKEASLDIEAFSDRLRQQTEKVRYVLRQKEDDCLDYQALQLQQEMGALEMTALDYEQQAQELKEKARQLRQQDKSGGKQQPQQQSLERQRRQTTSRNNDNGDSTMDYTTRQSQQSPDTTTTSRLKQQQRLQKDYSEGESDDANPPRWDINDYQRANNKNNNSNGQNINPQRHI